MGGFFHIQILLLSKHYWLLGEEIHNEINKKKEINCENNKIETKRFYVALRATLCFFIQLISFTIHGTPIYRRIEVDKFGNQIKDYHQI